MFYHIKNLEVLMDKEHRASCSIGDHKEYRCSCGKYDAINQLVGYKKFHTINDIKMAEVAR